MPPLTSILCFFLQSEARAAEVDGPVETAVLVSPLGSALGFGVAALAGEAGGLDEIGMNIRLLDGNLRVVHAPAGRLGWVAQVDATRLDFVMRTAHLGVRTGPRWGVGDAALEGWGVSPFVLAGHTWITAGEHGLARWWVVGVGLEATRTWVWEPLVLELGGGVYTDANVAYTPLISSFEDGRPSSLLPVKPMLDLNVGLGR